MAYARLADLYAQFGEEEIDQIADVDRTGTPDPATVGRAIANADAEINAALAVRYKTPVSPAPRLIKRLSGDLARWFLYGVKPTKEVDARAKLARDLLKALAAGEILLEGAASATGSFAKLKTGRRRMRWSSRDRG
ncbi:MAG: DUF1320 domain-containing protein [Azoarcus sp.]|jgi:phage gp36-like protein|nr:DUF1320 domain-containing protein [Azoarcus sp.]